MTMKMTTLFCPGGVGRSIHSLLYKPLYNGNGHLIARNCQKNFFTDQLIKDWRTVYNGERSPNLIHAAHRWSFFLLEVCFIAIFYLCYVFIWCNKPFFTALCFPESPSNSPRKTAGDNSSATTEYLKMARKGGGRKGMEWSRQSHASYRNC